MKTKHLLVAFLFFTLATFSAGIYANNDDIIAYSPELPVELKILSYELGAENNINIGSISGGGGAGKATFKEFTITKSPDAATTMLFEYLTTGRHMDRLRIKDKNMLWEFELVMIQDYAASRSDGDDQIEETWILQFGQMRVSVFPEATGSKPGALEPGEFCWSRVLNDSC